MLIVEECSCLTVVLMVLIAAANARIPDNIDTRFNMIFPYLGLNVSFNHSQRANRWERGIHLMQVRKVEQK